ncbi:MAG TPA: hypothetical protein VMR73_00125 [Candidatus Paceibacterota bacterium]|nr:hypothetical protein [Candidatus Paceibacterota bacterium]
MNVLYLVIVGWLLVGVMTESFIISRIFFKGGLDDLEIYFSGTSEWEICKIVLLGPVIPIIGLIIFLLALMIVV